MMVLAGQLSPIAMKTVSISEIAAEPWFALAPPILCTCKLLPKLQHGKSHSYRPKYCTVRNNFVSELWGKHGC